MSCSGLRHLPGTALTCTYCGTDLDCHHARRDVSPVTRDHRVPVVRGGASAGDNLVPACTPCNSAKGLALWPGEWTRAAGLDPSAVKAPIPLDLGLSARAFGILTWLRASSTDRVLIEPLREVFTENPLGLRLGIGELYLTGYVVPDVFAGVGVDRVGLRVAGGQR